MNKKRFLNECDKLIDKLRELQDDANKILNKYFYSNNKPLEFHILNVIGALEELSCFDLEDELVTCHSIEDSK